MKGSTEDESSHRFECSVRLCHLLGMALCGVQLGSSWFGSGLGPSLVPLGSALVRDSGWAGLAIEHLHWGWAGNIDESGSS